MKLTFQDKKRALRKTDLLAVLVLEGDRPELPRGVELPAGTLKAFRGEFRQCRATDAGGGEATRVVLVGCGKSKELDAERVRRAASLAVKEARASKARSMALWVASGVEKALGSPEEAGRAAAEGLAMAAWECVRFKGKPEPSKLARATVHGSGAAFSRGLEKGRILAEANALARDLQEAPGNLMRPRDMVAAARRLAARSPRIRLTTLTEAQMAKHGMGSLLSVSKGSEEPAYLIHLIHRPRGRSKGRVALVGKGLTFDAGGISIKPSAKMDEMKYDMSGGAAVLGVFHALAELDVPFEVHGVVPTSENLPDGRANKPGDIVTAMNGTTIEVLNTDAEGRLILADALAYVGAKVRPDVVLDLATLTGAVIVALGHEITGFFATSDRLAEDLIAAGRASGEAVWRLPLLERHKEHMKSRVADLRNINSGQGAGSAAGAAFLSYFVGDLEWAHLDIAGTAWGQDDRDYVGGNTPTGVGVRLLLAFLEARR